MTLPSALRVVMSRDSRSESAGDSEAMVDDSLLGCLVGMARTSTSIKLIELWSTARALSILQTREINHRDGFCWMRSTCLFWPSVTPIPTCI
jgi:hypothetical protein